MVAQEANMRERAASVKERVRIIVFSWLVSSFYEALAQWPSAYLLICIGAGAGGGGGGLEAQETSPPAMTDAARARSAYFIV